MSLGLPGVRLISTKDIKVEMLHLKIAEKDLAEGRGSVTPDAPVDVHFNIETRTFKLADGYHRYLDLRGGSVDEALKQAREGVFPNIMSDVTLVKTVAKPGFGGHDTPLTDEEVAEYIREVHSKQARLARAEEQGFDTSTVFYHGSIPERGGKTSDLAFFDEAKIGDNYWLDEAGFFFIDCPKQASSYAQHDAVGLSVTGGSVYPVHLAFKNPLIVDDEMAERLGIKGPAEMGVIGVWDEHHKEIMAVKGKHDGVLIKDSDMNQTMAVAFDARQVRSIHASFFPEHKDKLSLLGHEYTHIVPKPKGIGDDLSPDEILLAQKISDAIKTYADLESPQLTRKIIESLSPESNAWDTDDKLALFRRLGDRDVKNENVDIQGMALAEVVVDIRGRAPAVVGSPTIKEAGEHEAPRPSVSR